MAASRIGSLEQLVAAMRDLLGAIDDSGREGETLLAAWKRCNDLSDRFRAEAATVVGLSEAERAAVREHLATATRLNAIAAHLLQRESDRVSAELERLREVRRRLQEQRGSAGAGGSVNLAG